MNILFFGGDARQLKAAGQLVKTGYTVAMTGFRDVPDNVKKVLPDAETISGSDVIVLPVSGLSEAGEADAPLSHTPLFFTADHANALSANSLILTGIETAGTKKWLPRPPVALFEREDVAILNAIPTAEATLMIAIQQLKRTVHGSTVLVMGFGRVGMTVARLFRQAGAHVKAAIREPGQKARAVEMGICPIEWGLVQNSGADVIINTVPAPVLTKEVLEVLDPAVLIIDLASKPGGTDFNAAKKHGIQAIHALGLPGKTAPETAGLIVAEGIHGAIKEWTQKEA